MGDEFHAFVGHQEHAICNKGQDLQHHAQIAMAPSDDNEPQMKKMRLIEFLSEHIGLQGMRSRLGVLCADVTGDGNNHGPGPKRSFPNIHTSM